MEMSSDSKGNKRQYFVAFVYWKRDSQGTACRVIERELPVSGWDDILSMTDDILSHNPDMENVVITNWRKFEDSE
jgi:hypothetical protein